MQRRTNGGLDPRRQAANDALDAWMRAGRAAVAEDNVANGAAALALDRLLDGELDIEEARRLRLKFKRKADEAHDAERAAKKAYDEALVRLEGATA